MKKNMILGLSAFTIAIGSAVAMFAPETAYVRTQASQGAPFVCTATNKTCDNAGTFACQIQVLTTVSGNKTVPGRRGPDCTPTLKNTSAAVQVSNLEVYDAQ